MIVPLAIGNFVRNATRPLVLAVQANEGTVGLEDNGGRRPALLAGEPPQMVEGTASILTNTTDTALVTVYAPDEEQILARFKVNSNTNLEVTRAVGPRFELSKDPYDLELNLDGGILRVSLPPRDGRPLQLEVMTPQEGSVVLSGEGEYTVDAKNAETWVTVQEGEATGLAAGETLAISNNQALRLVMDAPPAGPLSSERDLLKNGSFNQELSSWDALAWNIERSDQPTGATSVVDLEGEKVLRFHRVGEGAARSEVRQPVYQDVTDFASLQLFVTMRVTNQSLEVCGQVGSECPLFVVMDYVDVNGVPHTWQQGFYAVGEPVPNYTPDVCKSCAQPTNPHVRIPLDQLRSWESGNLLEKLAQQNIPPRRVVSVRLVAQGHTFETQVFDVSLIATE